MDQTVRGNYLNPEDFIIDQISLFLIPKQVFVEIDRDVHKDRISRKQ